MMAVCLVMTMMAVWVMEARAVTLAAKVVKAPQSAAMTMMAVWVMEARAVTLVMAAKVVKAPQSAAMTMMTMTTTITTTMTIVFLVSVRAPCGVDVAPRDDENHPARHHYHVVPGWMV